MKTVVEKKKTLLGAQIGIVVSSKMEKTAIVEVERKVPHPFYGKLQKKRKKFMAENILGAKKGDKVIIAVTRPLSKRKKWRICKVFKNVAA